MRHPAILGVMTVLALSGAATPVMAQKSGGILKIYHRETPPSTSIHEEGTASTIMPFMNVMNNLVLYDQSIATYSMDTIRPDLAESWSWNDDRTKLTFKLREGVKWHDGKPFTSADVKCTWDLIQGKTESTLRKNPRDVWYHNLREVTTNGDHEVTFNLDRPQASILAMLASGYSPVYPCHVSASEMRRHPIGTGPFKFDGMRQNESVRLIKNEDYWEEGKPYLDGIEYTIIRSRSTRSLAFIAGDFDMTFSTDITVPMLRDMKTQAPEATCSYRPTSVFRNVLINHKIEPFDKPEIRRAILLTLDRKAFVDILSEGVDEIGGVMQAPPNGVWGMPDEILRTIPGYGSDKEADRQKAREIMKSLGYGPDNPLKVKVATRNIEIYRDPSVILIDQLQQVHFAAELDVVETSLWGPRMFRKDYELAMNLTAVGIDDPDVAFYENFMCESDRNYTGYCNREIEKKIEAQSIETDPEARRKLVWEIDKQLQEEAARPVVFHGAGATCFHPWVKNLTIMASQYNGFRYENVWLDR